VLEPWTSFALAHAGHGAHTLLSGVMHPLTGWDHALAMTTLGLWASQLGGRAGRLLPTAVLVAMTVGEGSAAVGVSLPGAEAVVLFSTFALGILVAGSMRISSVVAAVLAAAFALFHGYAHVAELVAGESVVPYASGFLIGSSALIVCGFAAGMAAAQSNHPSLARWYGAATAALALVVAAVRIG
jgi:urease accessory protein